MALLSLGSVMKISIKMSIIVDIWVFVSMISFMLGQVEHETRFFASLACLWEASSCALLLV